MAKQLRLRIVSPVRELYDDDVDMVTLRGANGEMGILPGHENRAAILGYGPLRIFKDGKEDNELAVLGGFAYITQDKTTVLSDVAEWAEDIDRLRAEAALDRA
ncbi:MAG: ATP synthase F1 subunit epsilon, partial [Clostridiales bacterium]|nr:ATP synthase F1 subunit epsilon [Clostridiales bacterium]